MLQENTDLGCFLCEQNSELEVHLSTGIGDNLRMIAGLGPQIDGYFVLGSRDHLRSFADAQDHGKYADQIEFLRNQLLQKFDSVLLTEHGRVPVCRDDGDNHDAHCFHAHLLGFPESIDIIANAKTYFSKNGRYSNLKQGMQAAASFEHYLLVSPSPTEVYVFGEPLFFPRQLVRFLIGHAINSSQDANWRAQPNREGELMNQKLLTKILADELDE